MVYSSTRRYYSYASDSISRTTSPTPPEKFVHPELNVRSRILCKSRFSGRRITLDDYCDGVYTNSYKTELDQPTNSANTKKFEIDPNYYKIKRGVSGLRPLDKAKIDKEPSYKLESRRIKFTDLLMPHERHFEPESSRYATVVTNSQLPAPGKQEITNYERTLDAGPRDGAWEKFTQPGFSGNGLYPRRQFAYEKLD